MKKLEPHWTYVGLDDLVGATVVEAIQDYFTYSGDIEIILEKDGVRYKASFEREYSYCYCEPPCSCDSQFNLRAERWVE